MAPARDLEDYTENRFGSKPAERAHGQETMAKTTSRVLKNLSPIEFRTILLSHGWFDLSPVHVDIKIPYFNRPFETEDGRGEFSIYVKNGRCRIDILSGDREQVLSIAARCLSLDTDISGFHAAVAKDQCHEWIIQKRFGRYLKSPTLFEDCYKVLMTTNINWTSSKFIVRKTVENYGSRINEKTAFPLPNRMLRAPEDELRSKLKCGYRAKYVTALCERAIGNPGLFLGDAWKNLNPSQFKGELVQINGLGEMGLSYLGRFYGKPADYTIDSWVINRCDRIWGLNFRKPVQKGKNKGKSVPDSVRYKKWAESHYKDYTPYGPNLFWFEVSRYWHGLDDHEGRWW